MEHSGASASQTGALVNRAGQAVSTLTGVDPLAGLDVRRAMRPDNTGGFDWSIAKDGKVLAEVFEHVGFAADGLTFDKRDAERTARLFAAAPDLLNALRLALPYVDRIAGTCPTLPQGIMRRNQAVRDRVAIRAAIAKAEGR